MATRFDPMTGEPIEETAPQAEGPQFDPMTGAPIGEAGPAPEPAPAPAGEPMQGAPAGGFDPMTGRPVEQGAPAGGFDPMTGRPVGQGGAAPKKQIPVKMIGIGVGAVAALAIIFGLIVPNVGGGKNAKYYKAICNTFKGSSLTKALDVSKILKDGKYTLKLEASYKDDASASAAYAYAGKDQSLEASAKYNDTSISGIAVLDDKQVQFQVPDLMDTVFTYDYTAKKKGYITEAVDRDTLDQIDETLAQLTAVKEYKGLDKKLEKTTKKQFNSLKFEKGDKETIKVDGKDRKVTGYKTTITSDILVEWCEAYEKDLGEMLDDLDEQKSLVKAIGTKPSKAIKEFKSQVKDADIEMDVTIYPYKKQLAAVLLEVEKSEVWIEFNGGSFPMENMVIEADGNEVFARKGETKGGVETATYFSNGSELELEYNSKSGELVLEAGDKVFEGIVSNKSNTLSVQVTNIEGLGFDYPKDTKLTASLAKGAKVGKVKKSKDTFDIGSAKEEDYEDLMKDLQKAAEDYEEAAQEAMEELGDAF